MTSTRYLPKETAELKAELRTEIAGLCVEMVTEIGELRKAMSTWMLTVLVTWSGPWSA